MKVRKLTEQEWKEVEKLIKSSVLLHVVKAELKNKTSYIYKLATLQTALKNGKVETHYGLCSYIESNIIFYLSPYWPKWSGFRLYPVVDKKSSLSPLNQYIHIPKWEDEQLKLRIDLSKFLLANIHGYATVLENVLKYRGKNG